MTPNEYQQLAARTECNQRVALMNMTDSFIDAADVDPATNLADSMLIQIRLNHSVIGLAGEVGELASLIQKWIYYNKRFDSRGHVDDGALPVELREQLALEYGDLLWYIAEGLNACGLNMEDVMRANIEKLKVRYPEKYTDYNAAHENRKLKEEESVLRIHEPAPMDYEMSDE